MANIKRVLMVTTSRGRGIESDPYREVLNFHDEDSLQLLAEHDPCGDENLQAAIDALLLLKAHTSPSAAICAYVDRKLEQVGALKKCSWNEAAAKTIQVQDKSPA